MIYNYITQSSRHYYPTISNVFLTHKVTLELEMPLLQIYNNCVHFGSVFKQYDTFTSQLTGKYTSKQLHKRLKSHQILTLLRSHMDDLRRLVQSRYDHVTILDLRDYLIWRMTGFLFVCFWLVSSQWVRASSFMKFSRLHKTKHHSR